MPTKKSLPENYFQFERLLVDLVQSQVDFAVVGGIAISLNGFIRATDDVDILIQLDPENVSSLLECLGNWGEGFARELTINDFSAQEGSIRVMEDFDLDIFTQMKGKSLDYFRPRLCYLATNGVCIPYLSPEDLVYLKQDSWREKDQIDVLAMKRIIDEDK
jgi:hypothetical protein